MAAEGESWRRFCIVDGVKMAIAGSMWWIVSVRLGSNDSSSCEVRTTIAKYRDVFWLKGTYMVARGGASNWPS